MRQEHLKDVHPDDVRLWLHVESAVWRLAEAYKLKPLSVIPTLKAGTKSCWGRCEWQGGTKKHPKGPFEVSITMRQCHKGRWQPRCELWILIDTICHELAHVAAGWSDDHGDVFRFHHGKLLILASKLKISRDILKFGGRMSV